MSAPAIAPAEQARPDPLAILGDSLALLSRLEMALPLVDAERRPLALLQLAIDPFGGPSLRRGSSTGDEAVRELASLLADLAPRQDGPGTNPATPEAFRVGMAEFALILPRAGRLSARRLAAALAEDVARIPLSIGIGMAEPGAVDLGTLLLAADGAVRAARAHGGGQARLLTRAPEDATGAIGVVQWLARRTMDTLRERDEVYQLAMTDPLTGLPNQRALARFLDIEVPRARRHGRPFAILLIDGDNLKTYNERYGYAAGDAWIKALGALLADQTRGSDLTVRWRVGDEFVIAMPETNRDAALQAAERIRLTVSRASAHLPIRATISIGVAAYPDDGTTHESLLARAEAANALAKSRGRDQIAFIADPPEDD